MDQHSLPVPKLYRVTNNYFSPKQNSLWVGEKGNIVRVTRVYEKKRPVIVS